jgi:hypothetical protein
MLQNIKLTLVVSQIEGFKMNLIYFDLYQSTRLEKFVTGKLSLASVCYNLCRCRQLCRSILTWN